MVLHSCPHVIRNGCSCGSICVYESVISHTISLPAEALNLLVDAHKIGVAALPSLQLLYLLFQFVVFLFGLHHQLKVRDVRILQLRGTEQVSFTQLLIQQGKTVNGVSQLELRTVCTAPCKKGLKERDWSVKQ